MKTFIASTIVALVALMAYALQRPAPRPAAGARPVAAEASAPRRHAFAEEAAEVLRREWSPGLELSYAYSGRMAVRMDGSTPDLQSPDAEVSGRWILSVEQVAPLIVQARLEDAEVVPADLVPEPSVLATPIRLHLDADGRLARVEVPRSMPGAARQTLRSIAATTQMVLRPGAAWRSQETHLSGEAHAHYRREGHSLERRRALIATNTGFSDETVLEVDAAHTEFSLHSSGHAERIEAYEALRLDEENVKLRTRQRVVAELLELRHGAVPEALTGLVAEALDATAAEDPLVHARQTLGDADFAALREAAAELDLAQPEDRMPATRVMDKADALLQIDPATAQAMLESVRAGVGVTIFTSALGNSGTAAGRAALVELLADEDPRMRVEAAGALTLSPRTDAATLEALAAALQDPGTGDAAALALGAAGRIGAGVEAEVEPIDLLLARFEAAAPGRARTAAIEALGNLGHPRAFPAMMLGLAAASVQEREAAIWGLRFIPGEQVDRLLEGLLHAPSTQLSALAAIVHRDPRVWRPRLLAMRGQVQGRAARRLESML